MIDEGDLSKESVSYFEIIMLDKIEVEVFKDTELNPLFPAEFWNIS